MTLQRILLSNCFCKNSRHKPTRLTASVILSCAIASTPTMWGAGLTLENCGLQGSTPIAIEPAASTGLEEVYVVEEIGPQSTVAYEATGTADAATISWLRFSNLGGGFAEGVPSRVEENRSVVDFNNIPGWESMKGIGLIAQYEGRQHCFWVVNYAENATMLNALTIAPELECDRTALVFDGTAPRIIYYSINGVAQTLSRDMQLEYNSLQYNEEKQQYEPVAIVNQLEYADGMIRTEAPLCDTEFTLTTDRFAREWGQDAQVTSPMFATNAIAATTHAVQDARDNDNEQRDDKAAIGGSGPVNVTFTAEVTDAVIYKEWQFSRDQQFDVIDLRIQEPEVEHSFRDYGTTYVRFVAGNDAGTCDYVGETYEVYVGESKLDCPNAFSPYGTEGTNDEWKVSYKSILDFDCHIFNRWGQEMAHLTDPSQGWDGRYKGKLVPSGVYYYVIKATGTDGKEYKLSGDINILKYTNNSDTRQQ